MSDTPETDDIARGNHVVPTEWAQQLERERDEAREGLAEEIKFHHRTHSELVQTQCQMQDFIRERDEARQDLEHWKSEWEIVEARLCGWKHPRDNGIIFEHEVIPVLRKERDEAREELNNIRINLGEDADGFTLLHAVCALQNERDDAREYSKATWQSLRYSQDEVLRLTLENRELRNLSNE